MKTDYQFEIDFCRGILDRDAKNLEVMEMLAGFYTKDGQIDKGLKLDQAIVQLKPESAISHYNLACSLSLKNRKQDALDSLRKAFEYGYDDINWMLNDPDLKNLQEDPAFSALVSEFQAES